jgi:hypothetical protein
LCTGYQHERAFGYVPAPRSVRRAGRLVPRAGTRVGAAAGVG